jgi:hypothetical protein
VNDQAGMFVFEFVTNDGQFNARKAYQTSFHFFGKPHCGYVVLVYQDPQVVLGESQFLGNNQSIDILIQQLLVAIPMRQEKHNFITGQAAKSVIG